MIEILFRTSYIFNEHKLYKKKHVVTVPKSNVFRRMCIIKVIRRSLIKHPTKSTVVFAAPPCACHINRFGFAEFGKMIDPTRKAIQNP